MIIVMASRDKADVDLVSAKVIEMGYKPHIIEGVERTVIAAVGDEREKHRLTVLESLPTVEQVFPILKPFKLAGKEVRQEPTVVQCGSVKIGGGHFGLISGPCSVESRDQIMESAAAVKAGGGNMLRGGAYKPRTSPYSFQGMEEEGLKLLKEAGEKYGLPVVTEVMTVEQIPLVEDYADMLQIGARNMQNYGLLKAVGQSDKPVFLKRGMMSTINEFLMSAEYIVSEGNPQIVLCERGIRTFETETRNTLDIQAVPVLRKYTHLPIAIDPSHASGQRELVPSMAKAAIAAGADAVMIEMHPKPEEAFSDGPQSLTPEGFKACVDALRPYLEIEKQKL